MANNIYSNPSSIIVNNKFCVVGVIVGLSIFLLAIGQLDLLCSPYVWADIHYREVFGLFGWKLMMYSGDFYNLMMWMLGLGLVIFGFSLWAFEEEKIKKLKAAISSKRQ